MSQIAATFQARALTRHAEQHKDGRARPAPFVTVGTPKPVAEASFRSILGSIWRICHAVGNVRSLRI
jgi:hypothetical protein